MSKVLVWIVADPSYIVHYEFVQEYPRLFIALEILYQIN